MAVRTDAAPKIDAASRTQGERIAALEASYEHVATKADIEKLNARIENLNAKIEKLKSDLTWRIVIAMSIMTGIFVAVVRLPA